MTGTLFQGRKALIGMVHVQALPGSPYARLGAQEIIAHAVAEAHVLAETGFDAVIVENMHDRPYLHGPKSPEVTAMMTRVAAAVREAARRDGEDLPLGIQILSGGNREAIAVALAVGAQFIRCENFVFSHVADEGLLPEAEAGRLLRYRKDIGAAHVAVFADVKKKHASHALTADLTIGEAAEAAQFFGADGLVVTGAATGRPTRVEDVAAVSNVTDLPVLVGSGVTPETVGPLLEHADGLIVGSHLKQYGFWENPIDPERCKAVVKAMESARG
jgi:membrane complex biogenesis BtpA family protein